MARGRIQRWARGSLLLTGALCAAFVAGWPAVPRCQESVSRVGVLAFRGPAAARSRWQPLIDYLDATIPGHSFQLVPVTLISAAERLEANALDFLITNPGHFVTLAERFRLSALATRERRQFGGKTGLLDYGTAIFARADATGLETLADLKGKTLAAVSPDAFGGFQMAWFEFRAQGINPFTDLKSIRYTGFPQDQVVTNVLEGMADAGTVRSGLLEALAREGRLKMSDVKVLLANTQMDYPFLVSSRFYPEWPFAARLGTDRRLAEAVTMALLRTQEPEIAERHKLRDLWSAPLSYEGVRTVIAAYAARRQPGGTSIAETAPQWFWLVAAALGAGISGLVLGYLARRPPPATGKAAPRGEVEVVDDAIGNARARFDALTRREREVLSLICGGAPSKSIAETLHISPKTVEYHRANLLQKTGAGSTPRMVQLATKLGFDGTPGAGEAA